MLVFSGKMLVVSAFLFGYYRVGLRNRSFHGFNRIFLLGMVVLAIALPLISFRIPLAWGLPEHYQAVWTAVVTGHGGGDHEALPKGVNSGILWVPLLWGVYGVGIIFFLYPVIRSFIYLRRLAARSEYHAGEGFRIYFTEEPGTPFSFFSSVFWNNQLDPGGERGRQVLRHELYHIRQRHTLDIIGLELLRAIFWWNPFLHWVLREIKAVHEFGADRYAIGGGSAYEYARLLVYQDPPSSPIALGHSFFHTQFKRRIIMITQSQSGKAGRLVRWMALPLVLLLAAGIGAQGSSLSSVVSVQDTGKHSIDPVLHYYLRHLRYPETARDAGREQTIWFSVKVDNAGSVTDFQAYDKAPDETGKMVYEVTVNSLPKKLPTGGRDLTEENMREVFIEEARKASSNMPAAAREPQFKAGEYLIKVVFRLERKPGADSTLGLSIEERDHRTH